MPHDFKNFPELTNNQLQFYYHESPHKQIVNEGILAKVVKVVDGDTIKVIWEERDFDFRVRFLNTQAPEMNEENGREAQQWLEKIILGEEVYIQVNPNLRVGKWGRLLGEVIFEGLNLNEQSIREGFATEF